jgi:hypothetical protein
MGDAGTAQARFDRAVKNDDLFQAELAARELGRLNLADALALCALLARRDPQRFERAARRWLHRYLEEREPGMVEIALAASALAELRHGRRAAGRDALLRLLRR